MKGGALAHYAHSPTKTPPLQLKHFPSPARFTSFAALPEMLVAEMDPLRFSFLGGKTAKSFFRKNAIDFQEFETI